MIQGFAKIALIIVPNLSILDDSGCPDYACDTCSVSPSNKYLNFACDIIKQI